MGTLKTRGRCFCLSVLFICNNSPRQKQRPLVFYEAQERNDGRSLEGEPLVRPLSFDEYTDTVCRCLERLSPEIVVHRLTGDCDKDSLVAPLLSLDKGKVINGIRHKMKERG